MDMVFLRLAGLLLGISLVLRPQEIPRSSSASPRKNLSIPPILLRLTQFVLIVCKVLKQMKQLRTTSVFTSNGNKILWNIYKGFFRNYFSVATSVRRKEKLEELKHVLVSFVAIMGICNWMMNVESLEIL